MHVFGKYFPPHLRVVLPVDRSHRRRVLSQEPWLQKKQTIREVASMIDMQATVCMCIFYLMNMCKFIILFCVECLTSNNDADNISNDISIVVSLPERAKCPSDDRTTSETKWPWPWSRFWGIP